MRSQRGESVICPENRDFLHSELTETAKWVVRTRNSFILNDKKTQNLAWIAQIRWLLVRGAEYGVKDTTEDELTEISYITEDLAPEVLSACNQWDGTVPEAPGDEAAREADDPLTIDTSQLRPLRHLFED